MNRILTATACTIGLFAAANAWSDEATPADMVSYREVVMESLGKHMKASSMIVKGKVDRPGDLADHAKALDEMADTVGGLFPEGTGPADLPDVHMEAKADIWTDREGFDKAVKDFQEATAAFVETTEGTDFDAMKKAFGAVGKTCGGCHDAYTVDEDEEH